ncbi:MAG: hypothetical protein ACI4UJ_04735 [Candidatus Cryptobacteroides sp.]
MKKTLLTVFLAAVAFPAAAQEFEKLFEDFVKEAKAEDTRFKDEANKRFADFLSESWTEFRVMDAEEYPRKPKPGTAPVAPVQMPIMPAPVVESTPVQVLPKDITVQSEPMLAGMLSFSFDFYGCPVSIQIPEKVANYRMSGNSEKEIAKFWKAISNSDYESLLGQLGGYASEMGLEGWSLYLLVEKTSKAVFGTGRENEMEVFKTFILNQLGMDARMGLADGKLKTMVNFKERVYSRMFCEFDGNNYYLDPEVQNVKHLLSYPVNFSDSLSPVSILILKQLHLGSTETCSVVKRYSNVFGTNISLPINTSQCDFYLDYPQVDVDIYARAAYDGTFTSALTDALRPLISGKDESAQVNLLLKFLQFDFKYSIDEEQFGYEKPFFLEENFIYPGNDCEDRAILFSFLVKNLLGLDVVLLDYPGHIATAVCFNTDVAGDSIQYDGRRYTICDPTYVGAPVGMAMKDYRNIKFNVLTL